MLGLMQPSSAQNKLESEAFLRFGQRVEEALAKGKLETAQDELVMSTHLLLQDALTERKLSTWEVQKHASIVRDYLCDAKQPNASGCAEVQSAIAVLSSLYGNSPLNRDAISGATTDLMFAVGLWLGENPQDFPALRGSAPPKGANRAP